jgi:hypothetical protein
MKRIILIAVTFLALSACSVSDGTSGNFQAAPLPTVIETVKTTTAASLSTTEATETEAEETVVEATKKTTEKQAETKAETKAETTAKTTTAPLTTTAAKTTKKDTEALYIKELFDDKKTDVWVSGKGEVTRILSDDNEGDRHQRFILEMSTGQTLLVAHNIDIAPRLDGLEKGDTVSFYGEYYWSDEGGGIHWTHHDPDGSSDGGWLKWNGETYK